MGDRIIEVNNESAEFMSPAELQAMLVSIDHTHWLLIVINGY